MTDSLRDPIVMFFAGVGIPILAALNAQLGARLGSPAIAAAILTCTACIAALIYWSFFEHSSSIANVFAQPKHLFLGGVLFAFYIVSITTIAPRFGVGNAVFFVLLGQMVAAAVIDQFGLFGAVQNPITAMRGAGIAMMVGGLFVIQQA
ncbi:DMT family transporter [Pacificibacter maritimus]|nr:DMT family transporter [Pacificibacter maritimus]